MAEDLKSDYLGISISSFMQYSSEVTAMFIEFLTAKI